MSKDIHQTDCRDCGAKLNQYSSEEAREYSGVTKWYPPQGRYERQNYRASATAKRCWWCSNCCYAATRSGYSMCNISPRRRIKLTWVCDAFQNWFQLTA